MNVALIGGVSSSLACLEALVQCGIEVRGVLGLDESQAERVADYRSLRGCATHAGAPYLSFVTVHEPAVERFLIEHRPDLLWVIGLSQLVPDRLMRIARCGGVGFHPTMLPRGRGRAPVAWTILLGERAAVSLFHLADEPDAGDIILQREVPVLRDDYSDDLIRRTNEVLRAVIHDLAPAIRAGTLPKTPQDHRLATYYAKRTPADGLLDWAQPTDSLYRLVRAVGRPYAGAFCFAGPHKVTIWRARPAAHGEMDASAGSARPGTVLRRDEKHAMLVRTGDGEMWVTQAAIDGLDADVVDDVLRIGARLTATPDAKEFQP